MSRIVDTSRPVNLFTSNLKSLVAEYPELEVRIISHAASHFYLVELMIGAADDIRAERSELLTRRGKPMLFRSLEDVYSELRRAGLHRAWLVSQVVNDEVIGRPPQYHQPLDSRMSLRF
ncbi:MULTISPECIES: DUF6482 family protein [Cobetia]|uniref:DUF6482 family protein n=1 Tax=Cobetia TaxID=204286 RepID=UPI001C988897|nr:MULTISPECIES: DUF6482 family protein [Cobetia]